MKKISLTIHSNWCLKALYAIMACLFLYSPACSQPPATPQNTPEKMGMERRDRPGRDRPALSDYETPDSETVQAAPQMPSKPLQHAAPSDSPKVLVREIKLTGNTIFPDEAFSEYITPYYGKEIGFEALQEIRLAVTRHYIKRGFINSGAVIPDQKVENGIIVIQIIEGKLAEIEVKGNDKLRTSYLMDRLALGGETPLDINKIQENVRMLHRNPLIKTISAELAPGLRLGEAVLKANVEENSPYIFGFEVNNRHSPRIGAEGAEIYAAHQNLSGWGDTLGIRAAGTRGLNDILAYYSIPVTAEETLLKLRYEWTDSDVIEDPFEPLDIEGKSETFAVELSHPLYRTSTREFRVGIRGEYRRTETSLQGTPFSFSWGMDDGEARVSVIRLTQEWLSRSRTQVFAVRSIFSIGIDALGATTHSEAPDSRFFSWLGQFQWARRIKTLGDSQVIFRTDMQYCNESVLPLEKISVGGAYSVRGYRENEFVRDNAVIASLEFRYPAFRLPIPKMSKTAEDGMVQLAAFSDFGWSENIDIPTVGPRTISSAGIGLLWDPTPNINTRVYWGIPFRESDYSSYNIQNDGIHFQLNWRVF